MRTLNLFPLLTIVILVGCQAHLEWRHHPGVEEEFNNTECVFVGTVVNTTNVLESGGFIAGNFYTIHVKDVLKGRLPNLIQIYNENSSGRFPMEVGVSYLVFASKQVFEGIEGPRLAINACGNSGTVEESGNILAAARKLKKQRNQAPHYR